MCHSLMIGALPFRLHPLHIRGTRNNIILLFLCITSLWVTGGGRTYYAFKAPPTLHRETLSKGCSMVENFYVSSLGD